MLENIIIIALVVLILGGASFYIYKAKKRGQKCVGCPYCNECSGSCSSEKSSDE